MRELEWVLVAILGPLLCIMLEQRVRAITQRRREKRLVGQTIAYIHSSSPENNLPQDANSKLRTRTADFTYKSVLDGLAPCPPNGYLVAYDTKEWVFGAILGPLLLDQQVRMVWRRRREQRLVKQTIAYLHRAASASNLPDDANLRPGMRTADFTEQARLDGLAPCPPNGDLVAYDNIRHEHSPEEHLQPVGEICYDSVMAPMIGPMSQ